MPAAPPDANPPLDGLEPGASYGPATISGHANVIQGNVYISQDGILEPERRREWERDQKRLEELRRREEERDRLKALRAALDFKGKLSRVRQLDQLYVPVESFDWVWKPKIPLSTWLRGSAPFLWLRGKPGSGKSTLMNYLVKSGNTHDLLLERWNSRRNMFHQSSHPGNHGFHKYAVMAFFFDFRAGYSEANDLVGLVKLFLATVVQNDEHLEKRLALRNVTNPIADADFEELLDLFCETVRALEYRICALVDGLDEYKGSHAELANTLRRIQDRTNMKMLLASRPEASFVSAFRDILQIQMQDHNEHSIRVYIDDAIRRGRETLVQIDYVLDHKMQEAILQRAEGVIIWARLAIDELFRAAKNNPSKDILWKTLELLPMELEEMYDLTVSRQPDQQQPELVLVLCLLDRLGGNASLELLRGAWDFCFRYLSNRATIPADMGNDSFLARMSTLLGSFVDILQDEEGHELRLMHRTLVTYLQHSRHVDVLLPSKFKVDYPDHDQTKFYAGIIDQAMKDEVFDMETIIDSRRQDTGPGIEWVASIMKPPHDKEWGLRVQLLNHSLNGLMKAAIMLEKAGQTLHEVMRRPLSSYLMILCSRYPVETDWNFGRQHDLIDLFMATELQLQTYMQERLDCIEGMGPAQWAYIYHLILSNALNDPNAPEGMLHIAKTIAPRVTVVLCETLQLCTRHVQRSVHKYLIGDLIKAMEPSSTDQINEFGTKPDECGGNNDLYHWWILHGRHSVLSQTLLNTIRRASPDVNVDCKVSGSALHLLLNECIPEHDLANCPLRYFLLFVNLGSDPKITQNGMTVLQLILALKRNPKIMSRRFLKRSAGHPCDLNAVLELLKFHDKNRCWPDMERTWSRLETNRGDANWSIHNCRR